MDETSRTPAATVNWQAIERSPEFRELVERRRRFLVPATIFWLAFFLAYLLLAAFAQGFMGEQIAEGFTVGFALSVAQVLMTWAVTLLYLRKSDREFEPLERRAAQRAQEQADAQRSTE